MWRCVNCGEKNEAPFKSCWQCESLRDGRQKAQFDASDSSSLVASVSPQRPLETDADLITAIATRFVCCKCHYRGAEVKSFPASEGLLSASCSHCSYTELYDAGILKRQGDVKAILTTLFGPAVN